MVHSRESGTARYRAAMTLDLFAGIPVSDYEAAKPRYERLLRAEPSFIPHATESGNSRSIAFQRERAVSAPCPAQKEP